MKIAITGHSKGLGKALYNSLIKQGHTCYGFSRSNGYDISERQDRKAIIFKAKDCDVFINNAYHEFAQCDLLEDIFEHWRDNPKGTIININSRSKYGLGNAKFYGQTKMELFKIAKRMMFAEQKKCRIININPGYIKTDMVAHVPDTVKMLSPQECADMIIWAMDQPQGIEIGELSCWRTFIA